MSLPGDEDGAQREHRHDRREPAAHGQRLEGSMSIDRAERGAGMLGKRKDVSGCGRSSEPGGLHVLSLRQERERDREREGRGGQLEGVQSRVAPRPVREKESPRGRLT